MTTEYATFYTLNTEENRDFADNLTCHFRSKIQITIQRSRDATDNLKRDLTDTCKNTTPVVNQQFVRKIELKQVRVKISPTEAIEQLIMFFRPRQRFWPICLIYTAKIKQKLAKYVVDV